MKARNPLKNLLKKRSNKVDKLDDASVVTDGITSSSEISIYEPQEQVSFNEAQNVYYESSIEDLDEIANDLWYSPDECKQMKESNSFVARTTSRSEDELVSLLQRAYQCCSEGHLSDEKNALKEMYERFPSFLGLECKLFAAIADGKRERRRQLLDLVYNFKHQNPDLSEKELAKKMRRRACEISHSARTFAWQLGQALEC